MMANIQEILTKILSSRYGKDMRQAIHDGIQQCYDDATEDSTAIDSTLSNSGEAADAKATGDALKDKLDTNQGSGNKGKAMVVGGDGKLIPGDVKTPVDETLSKSGEAADAKATGDMIISKTSQRIIGDGISNIVRISQKDYDMIEKDPETIYIIDNTEAYLIFDELQESYILTDYTPNTDTTYEFSIRVPEMIYRGYYLSTMITAREPNYSVMCAGAQSSANYMELSHANGAYADIKLSSGKTSKHVYKRTPTELFLDGISQKTVSAGTQQGNGQFVIGLPAADATHLRNTFHFFRLKIYENDELLHDYRPSKGMNDAACVFDTITGKYFYNSGTGSLTYTRGET